MLWLPLLTFSQTVCNGFAYASWAPCYNYILLSNFPIVFISFQNNYFIKSSAAYSIVNSFYQTLQNLTGSELYKFMLLRQQSYVTPIFTDGWKLTD